MRYLTIGHASYDVTFPVLSFPIENTKVRLTDYVSCGGGPASNAAYLLAFWNQDVSFQGLVGSDYYGKKIGQEFKDVSVDTTYFEQDESIATDLSFIMANTTKGTRTILTAESKEKKEMTLVNNEIYDVILVDGEEKTASLHVLENNKKAIKIIDAGSVKEGTLALCDKVDYLVCSLSFAEKYTNISYQKDKKNLEQMHNKLVADFHNTVVITLEDEGCFTKIENNYEIIPSIKVKAKDTTGAGDIFHGAFTYFISHGYSLKDTCRLANITGALSTLVIGGRFSMPRLDAVLQRYEDELDVI